MKTSKQRRATRGSGCWQRTETGWRYRIRIELPDGTKKTKSFSGKTQNACRHAAEDFKKSLLSSIDAQALRTLAEWGEIWLASKKGSVCYGTYHNFPRTHRTCPRTASCDKNKAYPNRAVPCAESQSIAICTKSNSWCAGADL